MVPLIVLSTSYYSYVFAPIVVAAFVCVGFRHLAGIKMKLLSAVLLLIALKLTSGSATEFAVRESSNLSIVAEVAGEKLGFLPGDLSQKVDPYLRPLYDALYDLMGFDKVAKAFERQAIEIAPLAFMRGRTLNNAFIILDEAQNTTPEQMKMFLTRTGFGAKVVVTGDVSQIDLPKSQVSGLIEAEQVLKRVKGIAITHFTSADVVRHPLVARIVDAYAVRGRK